jgi:hypothetical protein
MNNESSALLNEHQHRALSTRLAIIDRELFDAERLIRGGVGSGAMFETSNDLTAEERDQLLRLLMAGRERVRILRDRFGLAAERQNVRSWLLGHFSILWSILHDSRAEKLKGFGEVSQDLAPQLDPDINQLIEIVSEVRSIISSSHQPAGG